MLDVPVIRTGSRVSPGSYVTAAQMHPPTPPSPPPPERTPENVVIITPPAAEPDPPWRPADPSLASILGRARRGRSRDKVEKRSWTYLVWRAVSRGELDLPAGPPGPIDDIGSAPRARWRGVAPGCNHLAGQTCQQPCQNQRQKTITHVVRRSYQYRRGWRDAYGLVYTACEIWRPGLRLRLCLVVF
jgi:hypothetical protein